MTATFNPNTGEIAFGDMSTFRQGGGELIMYHGWADSLVTPQLTVDFYEALAGKSSGTAYRERLRFAGNAGASLRPKITTLATVLAGSYLIG
jgi:hypothetical protein